MECTIHERGNGFPGIGDYVADSDGELYIITGINPTIHTAQWRSNYIHADVERADWSDVSDDFESRAEAVIDVGEM